MKVSNVQNHHKQFPSPELFSNKLFIKILEILYVEKDFVDNSAAVCYDLTFEGFYISINIHEFRVYNTEGFFIEPYEAVVFSLPEKVVLDLISGFNESSFLSKNEDNQRIHSLIKKKSIQLAQNLREISV